MEQQYYNPEIWGGIECTINRVGNSFFDQLHFAGHYNRDQDIEAMAGLGIQKMRYPVLWEKHQPQKDSIIDWSWISGNLQQFRNKNIDIIAGLVHHGSGPAFTNLQDPEFPYLLAAYAKQVALQFPWINYYTPVNEPLTTARFSGLYGIWYPHKKSAKAFVQMLLNELKGTVLSMQEIRKINPSAQLIQTEDLGKTYSTDKLKYQADYENERRWLTFDILCGRFTKEHKLWKHFLDLGINVNELDFFINNPCVPEVFGFNYYLTSERFLDERLYLYPQHTHGGNERHKYADVEAVRVEMEEETGIEILVKEAWERYRQPIAITEVHLHSHREEQLRWFKYVWDSATKLKNEGIDLEAVTTWAVLGSFGWNKLLTEANGDYEPGAFDLRNGSLRATALARHIKEVNEKQICDHPLSLEKGWWHRNSRILYGPVIKEVRQQMNVDHANIVIIGKNGTLGRAFARMCDERCLPYRLLSRQECDISNYEQVEHTIKTFQPWAVINAAGFVRVDDAETNRDACFRDNTTGPENLAKACNKFGIRLINFSSDLVFDGTKNDPYVESDLTNPLNVYGESKALGEISILRDAPSSLVIRTSAFFGPWDEYNFVHYVRKKLQQYEPVSLANDIVISPTYVPDLVNATLDLLIDNETGIWHLANKGSITWSDWGFVVADRYELDKSLIQALPANRLGFIANRPLNSVLKSERGQLLAGFENAMDRFVHQEKTIKRKVA